MNIFTLFLTLVVALCTHTNSVSIRKKKNMIIGRDQALHITAPLLQSNRPNRHEIQIHDISSSSSTKEGNTQRSDSVQANIMSKKRPSENEQNSSRESSYSVLASTTPSINFPPYISKKNLKELDDDKRKEYYRTWSKAHRSKMKQALKNGTKDEKRKAKTFFDKQSKSHSIKYFKKKEKRQSKDATEEDHLKYQKKLERMRHYRKIEQQTNKEKVYEIKKRYRQNHLAEHKEYMRNYRLKKKQKMLEQTVQQQQEVENEIHNSDK